MSDEYAAVNGMTALSPREAVLKRPQMYFGARRPSEWPMVMLARTAGHLLERGTRPDAVVEVTVHRDGDFSASIRHAAVSWQPRRTATPEAAVLRNMWWSWVARSSTVTIAAGKPCDDPKRLPDVTIGEHGLHTIDGVDIAIRMTCDPSVSGTGPAIWWDGWKSRLPSTLSELAFAPGDDQRILAVDPNPSEA